MNFFINQFSSLSLSLVDLVESFCDKDEMFFQGNFN